MFIFLQDRKAIVGTFTVRMFRRTDDNEILAITEWPRPKEDKPEESILLGEYNNENDAKSVMKLLFADMKRREQIFTMPKKDGVAKMLKLAAERVAFAKKQVAEREARKIANEKAAKERKAEKDAMMAAHDKKLVEQAAAKAVRLVTAKESKAAAAVEVEAEVVANEVTPETPKAEEN